jgi:hypothetical protein
MPSIPYVHFHMIYNSVLVLTFKKKQVSSLRLEAAGSPKYC